ncbi:Dfp1/Him1, central region-domain-containing protein [Scheffersomyces amazonensis]|uniref:Dfp1/Him1, central region-domain-containing protein n=1 Tax=Scheffersomyces amazonensis TaxID=1078765 RepID=UPI00315D1ABF
MDVSTKNLPSIHNMVPDPVEQPAGEMVRVTVPEPVPTTTTATTNTTSTSTSTSTSTTTKDTTTSTDTAPPHPATNLKKRFNSLKQPRYPLKESNANVPSPILKKAKLNTGSASSTSSHYSMLSKVSLGHYHHPKVPSPQKLTQPHPQPQPQPQPSVLHPIRQSPHKQSPLKHQVTVEQTSVSTQKSPESQPQPHETKPTIAESVAPVKQAVHRDPIEESHPPTTTKSPVTIHSHPNITVVNNNQLNSHKPPKPLPQLRESAIALPAPVPAPPAAPHSNQPQVTVATQQIQQQQSKASGRLVGEELHTWQQSWRKIMKQSIIYFEGVQEYNRIQMAEYKRAAKLLKIVGSDITAFYDNDVTIIISRRSYNPKIKYPSNDIFSNVSNLKIKVWDYDKVFRFLKNLGMNIMTGVDELENKSKDNNLSTLLKEEKIYGATDRDPNTKREDLHYLDKNYLYVYDLSQKVRPIAIREWEEENYPLFNLTLDGKCPFINESSDNNERKKLRRLKRFEMTKEYRELLRRATNNLINNNSTTTTNLKSSCDIIGTSTSTDKPFNDIQDNIQDLPVQEYSQAKIHDEDTTQLINTINTSMFKQPGQLTRNSSCIQPGIGASNSKVFDVVASGFNGASNAMSFSMDSSLNSGAAQQGNGLGPMISQVPSRNLNNLKRRIIIKRQQQRENTATTATTAKKEKDDANKENNPGYCENCRVKYDNFEHHIHSNRHRNFACNDANFVDIDQLIQKLQDARALGFISSNGDYSCV